MLGKLLFAIVGFFSMIPFRLLGWKLENSAIPDEKFVLIAYPHTSNWDYWLMTCGIYASGRFPTVIIKDSWTKMPIIGFFIRQLGGVGVDRSKSHNAVDELAASVKSKQGPVTLIFTPEGTRSYRDYWKTGFYWTALKAGLRIQCVADNYHTKIVAFGPVITPTGDIEADFAVIRAFFEDWAQGARHPEKAAKLALPPEKKAAS